jgi:hypothetical protein
LPTNTGQKSKYDEVAFIQKNCPKIRPRILAYFVRHNLPTLLEVYDVQQKKYLTSDRGAGRIEKLGATG